MTASQDSVSTESRLTLLDRIQVALGIFLLGGLVRLLIRSYRITVISGKERLEPLLAGRHSAVVLAWHETLLPAGAFLLRHMVQRGFQLAILISLSRDGELLARTASRLGMTVVRGSTSRGGLGGLRRLYRRLARENCSVGLAPDGPRGPARECQVGGLLLAKISGQPVLPVGAAASRAWRLGSWDRMVIPRPFARVAIAVGETIPVDPALDSEQLAAQAQQVAAVLDGLCEEAEGAVSD